jgi:hypothetical protein
MKNETIVNKGKVYFYASLVAFLAALLALII